MLAWISGVDWPNTAMPPPLPEPGWEAEVGAALPLITLLCTIGPLPFVSISRPPP